MFFLFLVTLIVVSCDREDAWDFLKTAGEYVTEERDVEPFNSVFLLDRVNLEIIQDTINKLTLSGPKNLLAKITTDTYLGTLGIIDQNTFNWVRGYDHKITATIHVTRLTKIYYEGIGDIKTINTLKTDSLTLTSKQGSGDVNLSLEVGYVYCYFDQSISDVTLKGTASMVHVQINGKGFIRSHELITPWCRAFNQGSGDIYAYSSDFLHGMIEDSGNIFYTGRPTNVHFDYLGRGSGYFFEF